MLLCTHICTCFRSAHPGQTPWVDMETKAAGIALEGEFVTMALGFVLALEGSLEISVLFEPLMHDKEKIGFNGFHV